MVTHQTPEVFLGLDVGKTKHWACAITADRKVVWNKALPNDEAKLIDMYTRLQEHWGRCLWLSISPQRSEHWRSQSLNTWEYRWPIFQV